MIVQHATGGGPAGGPRWRCLARRGMLHSECEAVDLLDVPPGEAVTHRGSDGVDEAFYVVSGSGALIAEGRSHALAPASAALVPHDTTATLSAGGEGLRLLAIRVLPHATSADLPLRVPELPPAERTAIHSHHLQDIDTIKIEQGAS
ncbi:hypothetical protein ABZ860_23545 [Microbispora sp. NPDC046973]|uniref:hypothetical protein n=1 Tax=Microbispora sp. NPDC046973 TaxID=3155022 RepID=UPI0033FACA07